MSNTPIVDAASWLIGGNLAAAVQVIATLAIAIIGVTMLTGHLSVRRGGLAIVGCFVMFGSGAIAAALVGGPNSDAAVTPLPLAPTTVAAPATQQTVADPAQVDPYAGASLAQ